MWALVCENATHPIKLGIKGYSSSFGCLWQDTIDVSDTGSSDSSISGEGTGGLTASGGNAVSTSDQSSGGFVAAASIAAPAAGPASNLSASTVIVDPALVREFPDYVFVSPACCCGSCEISCVWQDQHGYKPDRSKPCATHYRGCINCLDGSISICGPICICERVVQKLDIGRHTDS